MLLEFSNSYQVRFLYNSAFCRAGIHGCFITGKQWLQGCLWKFFDNLMGWHSEDFLGTNDSQIVLQQRITEPLSVQKCPRSVSSCAVLGSLAQQICKDLLICKITPHFTDLSAVIVLCREDEKKSRKICIWNWVELNLPAFSCVNFNNFLFVCFTCEFVYYHPHYSKKLFFPFFSYQFGCEVLCSSYKSVVIKRKSKGNRK